MAAAGHDQADCADALRTTYGLASASQPNVSRWLRGTRPHKTARAALLRYCEDFPSEQAEEASRVAPDDVATLEELHRQVAGEVLLGPRQGALVDALIERLKTTPAPSSAEDLRIVTWLTRILGFDPPLE